VDLASDLPAFGISKLTAWQPAGKMKMKTNK